MVKNSSIGGVQRSIGTCRHSSMVRDASLKVASGLTTIFSPTLGTFIVIDNVTDQRRRYLIFQFEITMDRIIIRKNDLEIDLWIILGNEVFQIFFDVIIE